MKKSFRKGLQITSVRSNSNWNKLQIYTLLQNAKLSKPTINAYILTKFVNSKNTLIKIASEVLESKRPLEENIGNIEIEKKFAHSSLCIDGIPVYTGMKLKYLFRELDISEVSNIASVSKNLEFVKIPKEFCENTEVKKEYEKIMLKQLQNYRELKEPTREFLMKYLKINKRNRKESLKWKRVSNEILENLLPLGLNSRMSISTSTEEYLKVLRELNSSDYIVENEIGEMITQLLGGEEVKNFPKEVELLMQGTASEKLKKDLTKKIINYLYNEISPEQTRDFPVNELDGLNIEYLKDAIEELVTHYEALINPLGSAHEFNFTNEIQLDLGDLLFDNDEESTELGNIGQMGSIKINGMISLNLFNRLNQNESFQKFLPILNNNLEMDQELGRKSNRCFFLPEYLRVPEARGLKKKYEKKLSETYSQIKKWREKAKECLSEELVDEYTKYLLPQAHSTTFFMYASVEDFQGYVNSKLRDEDGNIDEKIFVYELLRLISVKDLIWKPLLRKHIKPMGQTLYKT